MSHRLIAQFMAGHWLVVDDQELSRMVGVELLRRLGATADTANDGIEALAAIERRRFVAVLMDGQMPEMDGYEAAGRIRESEAANGLPALPLVLVTADRNPEDRARSSGM